MSESEGVFSDGCVGFADSAKTFAMTRNSRYVSALLHKRSLLACNTFCNKYMVETPLKRGGCQADAQVEFYRQMMEG